MQDDLETLDHRLMTRCLELAEDARAAGNTPVGSLVAIGGEIIAEAAEATPAGPDRFAHAELVAVERAGRRLAKKHFPEATLYTTAEPCFLCTYAVREAKLRRIVIGAPVPEIGGATSQYPLLLAADISCWGSPPEVVWSELGDACRALFKR